jgi:hypothetical protein
VRAESPREASGRPATNSKPRFGARYLEHDGRIVFVDREPGGCSSGDADLAVADEAAKFCARLDAEIAVDPSEVGFSSRAFGHRYNRSDIVQ